MALTKIGTDGVKDDAVTSDKVADSINSAIAANTAKTQTTINNNADNRVITGSGTANTLNAESSVVIDSSGRVGIGQTTNLPNYDSSADRLVVGDGSADEGITIVSGQSVGHNGSIFFADGTGSVNSKKGQIRYEHNTEAMKFATNGSEKLRIDLSGNTLIGTDSILHSQNNKLYVAGTDASTSISLNRYSDNANAPYIYFRKSRSGTVGGNTSVQDNDLLGRIYFEGNDGSSPVSAAYIEAHVDGTPGTQDMPGRLEFLTTADGNGGPTQRMSIDSAGKVNIGDTQMSQNLLNIEHPTAAAIDFASHGVGGDTAYIGVKKSTGGGLTFGVSNRDIIFKTGTTYSGGTVFDSGTERVRFLKDGGITFNGDTAAANALYDYEEGTWTPTMTYSGGGGATLSEALGNYTKIGRMVNVMITLTCSAQGGGSGNVFINGLPFQSGSTSGFRINGFMTYATGFNAINSVPTLYYGGAGTVMELLQFNSTSASNGIQNVTRNNITSSTTIRANLTYYVD